MMKLHTVLRPTNGNLDGGRSDRLGGFSCRTTLAFSGDTQAINCLSFGVSENPDLPGFVKGLPLHAERQFKPVGFYPEAVCAAAQSEFIPQACESGN